ncbi:MAG: hypothetical protein LUC85_06750 [Bacteroidales bacterium]|nr:hypothetical protein [Bacteroidales bacterium]
MTNKLKVRPPYLLSLAFNPALEQINIGAIAANKEVKDITKIPEEQLGALLRMALTAQNIFSDEMIRRHPEMAEDMADFDQSVKELLDNRKGAAKGGSNA